MSFMRDYRSSRLDTFDVLRDVPQLVGWWKFDKQLAAVSDGTAIAAALDYSGFRADLPPLLGKPVKQSGSDGKPVARFGASQSFYSAAFGALFPTSKGVPKPLTIAALVKPASSGLSGSPRIVEGNSTGQIGLRIDFAPGICYGWDSAAGTAGQGITDDAWHVIVTVIDLGSVMTYIDGYYVGGVTGSAATAALIGLAMGSDYVGTNQFLGDMREVMISSSRLTHAQVAALGAYLGSQAPGTSPWPATTYGAQNLLPVQTVSGNGQAIRYFAPTRPAADPVLVLWCHPQGQDEKVSTAYFAYPYVNQVLARGGYFAASAMHGSNSWGNSSARADVLDLYNTMVTKFGTFNKVVLVGASMGAQAIAKMVAKATMPAGKVKALYFIDAATSLASMYANPAYVTSVNNGFPITQGTLSGATAVGATSLPTTSSFPTIGTQLVIGPDTANSEVVTTTGASTGTSVAVTATTLAHASGDKVSDYPTATVGEDAQLLSASSYDGVPMRFVASAGDLTVNKALNTDAFITKVTGHATEQGLITHQGIHLLGVALPGDFDRYVARVVGW